MVQRDYPQKAVVIVNYMKDAASGGEQIFYDIYSDEGEKGRLVKKCTGLFSSEVRKVRKVRL